MKVFDTLKEALFYEPKSFTINDTLALWECFPNGRDIDGLTDDEAAFITLQDAISPIVFDRLCNADYTDMFIGCLSAVASNAISTINRPKGLRKLSVHLLRGTLSPRAKKELTLAIKLAKFCEYGRLDRSTLDVITAIHKLPKMPEEYEGFEVEYLMWHTKTPGQRVLEYTMEEFIAEDGRHWRHYDEYNTLPVIGK